MADYTDEELDNMSDEELFAALRELDEQEEQSGEENTQAPTDTAQENESGESSTADSEEVGTDVEDSEQPADDTELGEAVEAEESEQDKTGDDKPVKANKKGKKASDKQEPKENERLTFRANGKDYSFTPEEIIQQAPSWFGQAMNYTQKSQKLAQDRKAIDSLKQAGVPMEDLNLLIDAHKGDQKAIATLLNKNNIDILDVDPESSGSYQPKEYGRDEKVLAIEEVVDSIAGDPEYAKTQSIVGKVWDDKSWGTISNDPQIIAQLHEDVRTGLYDAIQPEADKLKLRDGNRMSDLEYYKLAARNIYQEQQRQAIQRQYQDTLKAQQEQKQRIEQVRTEAQRRADAKKASAKRAAATLPTGTSMPPSSGVDYDSEEAYQEWAKRMENV